MVKFGVSLVVPLAANVALASTIEPRQDGQFSLSSILSLGGIGGSLANMILPKKTAFKIEQLAPKTNITGAKRVRLIHGPYKLRAANSTAKVGNGFSMDRGGTGYMYMVGDDFPKDITILETHSEIQLPDFKRATTDHGIYNHHNIFMEFISPPNVYGCEGGITPKMQMPFSIFSGGATEGGGITFWSNDKAVKSGYYLGKNRKVLNMIDVINYKNEEQEVYTATEVEYLPGKQPGYVNARQYIVDPGMCGGQTGTSIHPPKGVSKWNIKTSNVIALKDGWIINSRAHLHDGGINAFLKVNENVICNSTAQYGGEGHTSTTSDGKVWETIAESLYCGATSPVKKGDKVFMQANYDIDLHPSREQGGMGSMGSMGGMGAMKAIANALDGDAEQMALMVTYFASKEI